MPPVAVVCHDAGAANQIIFQIKSWGSDFSSSVRPYMDGPALAIWRREFPLKPICKSLEDALSGAKTLISGTGWGSDLEHLARLNAKQNNIYSVAVLDHWVNYDGRFIRGGQKILPDEIFVFDNYALKHATEIFHGLKIRNLPSEYMLNEIKKISKVPVIENRLLYITEPIRSFWGREVSGEFQALNFFIDNLDKLNFPSELSIKLRLHPSEPEDKYNQWLNKNSNLKISIDDSQTLSSSIGQANLVVGCESYALIIAMSAGRKTYSSLPPWAPPCRLPHDGLIHLSKA
jgi:hypothetical protein